MGIHKKNHCFLNSATAPPLFFAVFYGKFGGYFQWIYYRISGGINGSYLHA